MSENALIDALEADLTEDVIVSGHGDERVRHRLGLPRSAVQKEVERAKTKGIARTDLSGRMRRVLDALYHRHGHYGDYRLYRGWVFVFKGEQFVTVLNLSNGLHNTKAAGRGK